jgi:hypothetical protein
MQVKPAPQPYQPLVWPVQYTNPSGISLLFERLPYVGRTYRTKLAINRQLAERDPDSFDQTWLGKWDQSTVVFVTRAIAETFQWANALFSPFDPCEIALFDYDGTMRDVTLLLMLENAFRVELSERDIGLIGDLVRRCQAGKP